MKYSNVELKIIKDCKEMGFTNKTIADFLNKKEHSGGEVRTAEGIRKVK